MQVTRTTFLPLLAPANSDRIAPGVVRDDYCADLCIIYSYGPQFGRRIVMHPELEQMQMQPTALRRAALEHLEVLAGRAEFHGQPPALMLSFEGLESSLLLATDFWTRLQGAVPGELVVGVPARDVVIVTGTQSTLGLEKARRCVDRVFMAGDDFPLTPRLLVRRGTSWEPFEGPARRPGHPINGMRRPHGPGQPPRQYQEHPSWPSERLAPVSPMRPSGPRPAPGAVPMRGRPAQPFAPAAQTSPASRPTGSPVHLTGPISGAGPGLGLGLPAAAGLAGPGAATAPGNRPAAPVSPGPSSGSGLYGPGSPAALGLPPQRPTPAAWPADIAPYSAVPLSAVPYSAVPFSAVPYSAVPHSAVPYSAMPYSGPPVSRARLARPTPVQAYDQPKPAHRDDSAASDVGRPSYPLYEPSSAYRPSSPAPPYGPSTGGSPPPVSNEAYGTYLPNSVPSYPASWDRSNSHPEWRASPRARFSSR